MLESVSYDETPMICNVRDPHAQQLLHSLSSKLEGAEHENTLAQMQQALGKGRNDAVVSKTVAEQELLWHHHRDRPTQVCLGSGGHTHTPTVNDLRWEDVGISLRHRCSKLAKPTTSRNAPTLASVNAQASDPVMDDHTTIDALLPMVDDGDLDLNVPEQNAPDITNANESHAAQLAKDGWFAQQWSADSPTYTSCVPCWRPCTPPEFARVRAPAASHGM